MKWIVMLNCAFLAAVLAHADEAAIAPKCLYSVSETSQETQVKPEKVVTVSAGGVVSGFALGVFLPSMAWPTATATAIRAARHRSRARLAFGLDFLPPDVVTIWGISDFPFEWKNLHPLLHEWRLRAN